MKITYDTVTDSISCPDLDADQTRALQSQLSSALLRNEPVQNVVAMIMTTIKSAKQA